MLAAAGNVEGQIFVAVSGDQHDILNANALDLLLVLSDLIAVDEAQVKLVELLWHFTVQEEVSEVAAWLDRDDHVFFDDASSADVLQARLLSALGRRGQVTTDVVSVKTDQMAETVRHEQEPNALLHHHVDIATETSQFFKTRKDDSLSDSMHLNPVRARLESLENCAASSEHHLVDISLLLGEFAVDGP